MSFHRVHQSRSQGSQTSSGTSQFAPRPFPGQEPKRPPTPEEIENEAFQQNKFETFGLQLKERHGTITPVEQERLGMLQAKMDSFWAQRMEQVNARPNLLEILIRNTQTAQAIEPAAPVQPKLTVGQPNDQNEQEADRVAEQVMSMAPPATPNIQPQTEEEQEEVQTKPLIETITPIVQRQEALEEDDEPIQAKCESCEEQDQVQRSPNKVPHVQADLENRLNASKGGGSPLPDEVRSFMEPRFKTDFSQVRVHTGSEAVQMNRELNAQAFTHRQNIYFGAGKSPGTDTLTAHELTHVVQQGAIPSIQNRFTNVNSKQHFHSNELYRGISNDVLQRFPGDGMTPPGDCTLAKYVLLRGSVETAKAVVNMLGGCSAGDSCLLLATKIAAISAEIAARVAHDATCFKGGNTGHRQQVQDKIVMMNRCYRFFSGSNCSPELIAAMAVVVERAREVIAAGAVVVAAALVVALIAAIIALAEVIAALAAAAAEGAAVGAAAAAVIALLVTIREGLSSEES